MRPYVVAALVVALLSSGAPVTAAPPHGLALRRATAAVLPFVPGGPASSSSFDGVSTSTTTTVTTLTTTSSATPTPGSPGMGGIPPFPFGRVPGERAHSVVESGVTTTTVTTSITATSIASHTADPVAFVGESPAGALTKNVHRGFNPRGSPVGIIKNIVEVPEGVAHEVVKNVPRQLPAGIPPSAPNAPSVPITPSPPNLPSAPNAPAAPNPPSAPISPPVNAPAPGVPGSGSASTITTATTDISTTTTTSTATETTSVSSSMGPPILPRQFPAIPGRPMVPGMGSTTSLPVTSTTTTTETETATVIVPNTSSASPTSTATATRTETISEILPATPTPPRSPSALGAPRVPAMKRQGATESDGEGSGGQVQIQVGTGNNRDGGNQNVEAGQATGTVTSTSSASTEAPPSVPTTGGIPSSEPAEVLNNIINGLNIKLEDFLENVNSGTVDSINELEDYLERLSDELSGVLGGVSDGAEHNEGALVGNDTLTDASETSDSSEPDLPASTTGSSTSSPTDTNAESSEESGGSRGAAVFHAGLFLGNAPSETSNSASDGTMTSTLETAPSSTLTGDNGPETVSDTGFPGPLPGFGLGPLISGPSEGGSPSYSVSGATPTNTAEPSEAPATGSGENGRVGLSEVILGDEDDC